MSQVTAGGFAAVDLGFAGCQLWPRSLRVTSPVAFWAGFAMPAAFTADASGDALQPAANSSAWQKLLEVQGHKPDDIGAAYPQLHGLFQPGGNLAHDFLVLPKAAQDGPPTLSAVGNQVGPSRECGATCSIALLSSCYLMDTLISE